MLGIRSNVCERHLMRAERSLDWHALDLLGPSPSFGCSQDDHRPRRATLKAVLSSAALNAADLIVALVQSLREELMHRRVVVALDEERLVAVPLVER